MLEYKIADYCIIIWDSDRTTLDKSLVNLMVESTRSNTCGESAETADDLALDVVEHACALKAAIRYEGEQSGIVLVEIGDTVFKCVELAKALGFANEQVAEVSLKAENK